MSFWNNPGASFEGLAHDPWHSMQNFMTTGVVPMLPYIAGAIGGAYGGPAGAAAAGGATQEGIDYFGGNSQARTGQGIMGSLMSGAGKGQLGSSAYGAYDTGSIGPSQGQQGISQLMKLFGNSSGGSTGGSSTGGTSSSSSPLNYFQARNQKIQELQKYITGEPPLTGIGNQVTVAADAEKQALEGSSTDKNKPEYVADSKPVEVFNDETNEG